MIIVSWYLLQIVTNIQLALTLNLIVGKCCSIQCPDSDSSSNAHSKQKIALNSCTQMYNGYWTEKHHSLKNLSKYTYVLTTPLNYWGKMVKLNIFIWHSSSTSCLTKVSFVGTHTYWGGCHTSKPTFFVTLIPFLLPACQRKHRPVWRTAKKRKCQQIHVQHREIKCTQALTALKMTMARHSMMSRKSHGISISRRSCYYEYFPWCC